MALQTPHCIIQLTSTSIYSGAAQWEGFQGCSWNCFCQKDPEVSLWCLISIGITCIGLFPPLSLVRVSFVLFFKLKKKNYSDKITRSRSIILLSYLCRMFSSRLLDWGNSCFGFSLKSVLVYIPYSLFNMAFLKFGWAEKRTYLALVRPRPGQKHPVSCCLVRSWAFPWEFGKEVFLLSMSASLNLFSFPQTRRF